MAEGLKQGDLYDPFQHKPLYDFMNLILLMCLEEHGLLLTLYVYTRLEDCYSFMKTKNSKENICEEYKEFLPII